MAPVRPEGPYPEQIFEAEMLVRAQDAQRTTVPDELGTVTEELVQLTEMLKKIPVDQIFDFKEIKAVLDRLEALIATSPAGATKEEKEAYEKDLKKRTAEEFDLRNRDRRNEASTRFGRVYYGTGETIPPNLTKEEWGILKNKVKDEHVDDPAPGPNDGLSDNDLYEEMKAEEAMEKKATSEDEWYRKAGVEEEVKSAEGFQTFLTDKLRDRDGPGIQPDKPWPRVEQPDTYPAGQARYVDAAQQKKGVDMTSREGHYNVARYEANQAKIRKELKKERWYKALTLFCKAIVVFIGIFYGIIIIEQLLVGKPIATFLNRVVFGQ